MLPGMGRAKLPTSLQLVQQVSGMYASAPTSQTTPGSRASFGRRTRISVRGTKTNCRYEKKTAFDLVPVRCKACVQTITKDFGLLGPTNDIMPYRPSTEAPTSILRH